MSFTSEPAPNIELTLPGLTITDIRNVDSDRIEIDTAEGRSFILYHSQDCCESVRIDEVIGSFDTLVGYPLLEVKEEIMSGSNPSEDGWPEGMDLPEWKPESYTWTTFTFTTVKGTVVIRWYGESNGHYSESVSFVETTHQQNV